MYFVLGTKYTNDEFKKLCHAMTDLGFFLGKQNSFFNPFSFHISIQIKK